MTDISLSDNDQANYIYGDLMIDLLLKITKDDRDNNNKAAIDFTYSTMNETDKTKIAEINNRMMTYVNETVAIRKQLQNLSDNDMIDYLCKIIDGVKI